MIKRQDGFTLVELMITTVILLLAIAAASGIFTGVLNQFKQQAKIGETDIEGIVGLEILRSDIEQAGYGLPWGLGTANYDEAVNDLDTAHNAILYNDAGAVDNPPRAIVGGQGVGINGSDVLVIKASNVAINLPTRKWAYVSNTGAGKVIPVWENIDGTAIEYENLETNDRVIVLRPTTEVDKRVLVNDAPDFFTLFDADSNPPTLPPEFSPASGTFETYMIYGIDPDTDPRMPFNRADYYISTTDVPEKCADAAPPGVGTGVLVKAVIDQADGDFDLDGDGTIDEFPLLDCVADLQIILRLDMDDDRQADTTSNADGSVVDSSSVAAVQATLGNAALLRQRLKEVRVFILAHEGQRDTTYTFSNFTGCGTCITVGDPILGRNFDFSAIVITDYLNYRWKVYSMVLKPYNLEG